MSNPAEPKKYGLDIQCYFPGGADAPGISLSQSRERFWLHCVAIDLRDMAENTGNDDLFLKIARIRNNKGALVAYWHEAPTDDEKAILEKIWLSQYEDGDFIKHELEEKV